MRWAPIARIYPVTCRPILVPSESPGLPITQGQRQAPPRTQPPPPRTQPPPDRRAAWKQSAPGKETGPGDRLSSVLRQVSALQARRNTSGTTLIPPIPSATDGRRQTSVWGYPPASVISLKVTVEATVTGAQASAVAPTSASNCNLGPGREGAASGDGEAEAEGGAVGWAGCGGD